MVRGGVSIYFTILLFPTFLNIFHAVEESLNVSLSLVTLFLTKIILVFFLMAGMAWVANMSTISLFQQIKYMSRRIKKCFFSYNIDSNKGKLTLYCCRLETLVWVPRLNLIPG